MSDKKQDKGALGKIGDVFHSVTDPIGETFGNLGHTLVDAMGNALGPKIDVTGKIFLTGAMGVISHRAAARLLESQIPPDHAVRLGARDATKLEHFNEKGAEIVTFCWDREDTYESALKGVKTVFCVTPYIKGWEQKFPLFLSACKKAGVQYFVKLSFYHARKHDDPFQAVPLVKLHAKCDKHLAKSGIPYTILSASHFMSNPMVFQGKSIMKEEKPAVFYGSSHEKGVNYVSPNDVSEVAVRVLFDPRPHIGKEYALTGPEAVADQTVAQMLGKALDKPVMYVDQPIKTFEDSERFNGHPDWMVNDLVALETIKATGHEESKSFASSDIKNICGHEAESFEAYLEDRSHMTPREMGTRAA